MSSTASLIKKFKVDFPNLNFEQGSNPSWSKSTNTIVYSISIADQPALFHELAHSQLGHTKYLRDIELLAMERDAWNKARQMAIDYDIEISDDVIQDALDTYRDWLHARSKCKKCNSNGMQISLDSYKCPVCDGEWRVNEAKTRSLRRYKTK